MLLYTNLAHAKCNWTGMIWGNFIGTYALIIGDCEERKIKRILVCEDSWISKFRSATNSLNITLDIIQSPSLQGSQYSEC